MIRYVHFIVILFPLFCYGQDFHYTQFENTISLNNPACVGNFNGLVKLTSHYRNQWVGTNSSFRTSLGMVEMNFKKKNRREEAFLGVGAYFLNDIGGDSRLGKNTGGISASGNIPLSKNQWFSGGLNLSFNQRTIDLSNVTFLSQWDGSQLNNNISSGENNGFNKDFFVDVGLGLSFNFNESTDLAFNSRDYSFSIGACFQHLNQPKMNFVSIDQDKLFIKSIFHLKYTIGLSALNLLEFTGAQIFQGPHQETLLGLLIKNKFKERSHFTSLVDDHFFSFGFYFRTTADICPMISVDIGPLKLSVNYDYNIRYKTNQAYKHAFELQLAYLLSKSRTFKF